jgi:hypothetical protein
LWSKTLGREVGQLTTGLLQHAPHKRGIRGETANWHYIPPYQQGDKTCLFALLIDNDHNRLGELQQRELRAGD